MTIANDNFSTLLVEDKFPVLTVTLNRPKVANAMNLKMVNDLMQVMTIVKSGQYRIWGYKDAK